MHDFFTFDISMSLSQCFVEMSQTIVAVRHTYVHFSFEHESEAIGRRCRG